MASEDTTAENDVKELVGAYFKVISHDSFGETEKTTKDTVNVTYFLTDI
jgi:hypothetical protein